VRLCIVTSEYPPVTDYWGGIGAQYARLAPELARCAHDVHVVTLPPGRGDAQAELAGVRIHALAAGRHLPWRALARARTVAGELRRLGPFDAILAPEFRGEAALYAGSQDAGPLLTHLLTSSAQLLAIRPGLTLAERRGASTRLTLALERRQAERSTALIAPGSAILEWARELWDLEGIAASVAPLCIDVAGVRAAAAGEPPPGFPREGPVVSFASRLDGHKGAQHLVSAMKPIWEDHPDVQLAFVGRDAPWERRMMSDHLRELAGAHVDRIHVMGYLTTEEYFACVARSDVIAIPSLWESFCIAAVEAMALGRPLVGTRGHGFSEFVEDGENGVLVERGSVPELETALRELLADADRRGALGRAAGRTAERLDAAVVAPAFAEEIERLLAGAGGATPPDGDRAAGTRPEARPEPRR
jgi:glycosyltransferase involved in cell wall biosynthesis